MGAHCISLMTKDIERFFFHGLCVCLFFGVCVYSLICFLKSYCFSFYVYLYDLLQINFSLCCEVWTRVGFFPYRYLGVPAPFVEQIFLSHKSFGILIKNQMIVFLFCFIIYLLIPFLLCLDYCSCTATFEASIKTTISVVFFKVISVFHVLCVSIWTLESAC